MGIIRVRNHSLGPSKLNSLMNSSRKFTLNQNGGICTVIAALKLDLDGKGRKLKGRHSLERLLYTTHSQMTQQWQLWEGKTRDYIKAQLKH